MSRALVQLHAAGQHLQFRFCLRKVIISIPLKMLPAEKLQQESLRGAWRCPCAHLVLLNSMSHQCSHTSSQGHYCSSQRQEDKDGERYHIHGGCSDPAANTCLWDTQPKDASAVKFLFLRHLARKLFEYFYDKWRGKLCGQQGVWLTLSQVLVAIFFDHKQENPLQKPGNSTRLTANERCWSKDLRGWCRNAFK